MKKYFLYLYKGNYLLEQPKHTRIVKLQYIDDEKGDVAVCKRVYNFPYFICLGIIIALIAVYFTIKPYTQVFTYRDTMYIREGYIEMNLQNSGDNICPALINMTYNDKPLIETLTLNPGDSVDLINVIGIGLAEGSYMCKLSYTINMGIRHVTEYYNVLVIVE